MNKHRVAILLLAVVAASALALGARADVVAPDGRVPVLVQPAPEGFSDGGDIPEGLIAVFVRPAPDGFSDGGDIPDGFVLVMAQDGFSDGGDIPVLARAAGEGFSDGGDVPDGMIVAFAEPAEGGLLGEDLVTVLMEPYSPGESFSPRG